MNHGVYDFVRNNVPGHNEWKRSAAPPKGPMVQGWDGLAQKHTEALDVHPSEYMNQKVYNTIEKEIPSFNQWSRSAHAPTGPAVPGWDGLL